MTHSASQNSIQPVQPSDSIGPVFLSGRAFVAGCVLVAVLIATVLPLRFVGPGLLASEVLLTVLGLFFFGSFRYQLHKNALTYGLALVVLATYARFCQRVGRFPRTGTELVELVSKYLLSFSGLDQLIHIDTLLFILGLTLLVSVLSQTRLLEALSLSLLRWFDGRVAPTLVVLCGVVALLSGVLDGVSMIGLLLRTLALILFMAGAPLGKMRRVMLLCTIVTTVCGMWLAYGEPPNLIMKANLLGADGEPLLSDRYFLHYCLPLALLSFGVIALQLLRLFWGQRVNLASLDLVEQHAAEFRFLQARRHGEVFSDVEVIEAHREALGVQYVDLVTHVQRGASLGEGMQQIGVPAPLRRQLLGMISTEELALRLDDYFGAQAAGDAERREALGRAIKVELQALASPLRRFRALGLLGLLLFVALLFVHARSHVLPLFVAPLLGALVAALGLWSETKIRRLALTDTAHEYAEYLFLIPLFLSITLLLHSGFFVELQSLLHHATQTVDRGALALLQLVGCTALSAILDNNVVADFASRALTGLPIQLIYLFATAQIAGYAAGGCWTHIGSAQSVVAFAFIHRDLDAAYTPVAWIKDITSILFWLVLVLGAALVLLSRLT